jgi:hypothetical protein
MGTCRRAGDLVGFDRKRKSRLRFFTPSGAASRRRAGRSGKNAPAPDSASGRDRFCLICPANATRQHGAGRAMLHFRIDRFYSKGAVTPSHDCQTFGKTRENPGVENKRPILTTFVSAFLANLTFHAGNGMGMIIRRTRRGALCFWNRRFPLKAR